MRNTVPGLTYMTNKVGPVELEFPDMVRTRARVRHREVRKEFRVRSLASSRNGPTSALSGGAEGRNPAPLRGTKSPPKRGLNRPPQSPEKARHRLLNPFPLSSPAYRGSLGVMYTPDA